jgi:HSP20 family protein
MTCSTTNRVRECLPNGWSNVDSLLNQFFGPNLSQNLQNLPGIKMTAGAGSVWEDEGAWHIEMDVPGVARDDVELTYDKGELCITAERKAPLEKKAGSTDERRYGKMVRTVSLPESVDPDTIDAQLADGVLHVSVSKKPEAQPKRIEVK